MGSGAELGADYVDQDMMSNDRETLAKLGLDDLRIGDILAIKDHDHTMNRGYREGAVTIGSDQSRRLLPDRPRPGRDGHPLLRD